MSLKNYAHLANWIRKDLKENHKYEIEHHSIALIELNQRYKQIQEGLDRDFIYDKLGEKISEKFYQRKFKQYIREK